MLLKMTGTMDISGQKRIPYPKSVFFIVTNEFCERFSYYGMRTILILYLTNILFYSEEDSKVIYHTFTMLVYFFPLLGAVISDSFLGKFRTILYVSIIYAAGSIVLALASAEPIGLPQAEISMVGLFLIAIGTGGIKPCVSAFGGDQFVLPQQELQLQRFFSLFYFAINAGSFISTFITPILRSNVKCFDQDSCFPLAFAVPGVLMIVSIIVFALGKPLYKIKKPTGNILLSVCKCIGHALSQKRKSKEKKDHWLEYADDKYDKRLIEDIKATLKVLVLYIPLPIFWALFDQQGSGWTFQAVRMNGDIGFYTILPDQMQVVNPLLILAFIPMFSLWVYPLLGRCNLLKTPLQKMVCGGFLAAIAFAISAFISMGLEATYPVLPSEGLAQVRIYNPLNCDATVTLEPINDPITIKSMSFHYDEIKLSGTKQYTFNIETPQCASFTEINGTFNITDATSVGFYFTEKEFVQFEDSVEKPTKGFPNVRTLVNTGIEIVYYTEEEESKFTVDANNISFFNPDIGKFYVNDENRTSNEVEFKLGGVYTVLVNVDGSDVKVNNIQITEPNSVHILLLLPQYIILTAAEIMFSVTGLELSYSQAPVTMKSVLQACFLLTTAIGNLIIVIIESAKIFEKQSHDFFLYAGLMVIDMVLFMFLAMRYKYVENYDKSSENSEVDDLTKEKENPTTKAISGIDNPTFKESNENQ